MKKHRFLLVLILVFCVFTAACSHKTEPYDQFTYSDSQTMIRINIKDCGYIDLILFDDEIPEAVEAFKNNVFTKVCDNVHISNTIEDYLFMVNASPDVTFTSECPVSSEFRSKPYRGTLCVSLSNGVADMSSFFVVDTPSESIQDMIDLLEYKDVSFSDYLRSGYGVDISDEELNTYLEKGGAPWLAGHCVPIGQIYEGYDCLEFLMGAQDEIIEIESIQIIN